MIPGFWLVRSALFSTLWAAGLQAVKSPQRAPQRTKAIPRARFFISRVLISRRRNSKVHATRDGVTCAAKRGIDRCFLNGRQGRAKIRCLIFGQVIGPAEGWIVLPSAPFRRSRRWISNIRFINLEKRAGRFQIFIQRRR